jgi:hypothetical protein
MLRDLLHHKEYMVFWGVIMLVFLAVSGGILYELHQIVVLLRRK